MHAMYRRCLRRRSPGPRGLHSAAAWGATAADRAPVDYGKGFGFDILKPPPPDGQSCGPRLGRLQTPHGDLKTPAFVFCATKAALKGTTMDSLEREHTQIILSNTYHLMNRPGADLVQQMGGLHRFMGWDGPLLTDSGGYQIFSMGGHRVGDEIKGGRTRGNQSADSQPGPGDAVPAKSARFGTTLTDISEEGASFRSYVDGSLQMLSPEESLSIQRKLGADLVVVMDECTPFHVDPIYTELSMNRSHRWALRSLRAFKAQHDGTQALYGIVQGGVHTDLRDQSVDFVNSLPFFGVAIGGSLGDSVPKMHHIVEYTRRRIGNTSRPVHLLGIGGIVDVFHGVRCGVDTFDCVMPTRAARHGNALVMAHHWEGELAPGTSADSSPAVAPTNEEVEIPVFASTVTDPSVRAEVLRIDAAISSIRAQLHRYEQAQLEAFEVLQRGNLSVEAEKARRKLLSDKPKNKLFASLERMLARRTTLNKANSTVPDTRSDSRATRKSSARKSVKPVVRGHISLTKASMRTDPRPIDPSCDCYTCSGAHAGDSSKTKRGFSRAYLHHLFKSEGERSLAGTLVTIHNVHFMNKMMDRIREGIATDTLDQVQARYIHPAMPPVS